MHPPPSPRLRLVVLIVAVALIVALLAAAPFILGAYGSPTTGSSAFTTTGPGVTSADVASTS